MIRSCTIHGCTSKRGDVTLHKFPIWNKAIFEFKQWVVLSGDVTLLQQTPESAYNSRRICHKHFEKHDLVGTKLAAGAIPKLNLPDPISISDNWYSEGLDLPVDVPQSTETTLQDAFSEIWETTYTLVERQSNDSPRKRRSPRKESLPLIESKSAKIGRKCHQDDVSQSVMGMESLSSTSHEIPVQSVEQHSPATEGESPLTVSKLFGSSSDKAKKLLSLQRKAVSYTSARTIMQCKNVIKSLKKKLKYYQRKNVSYQTRLREAHKHSTALQKLPAYVAGQICGITN